MEEGGIAITFLVLIALVGVGVFFVTKNSVIELSPEDNLEGCNVLQQNGEGVDILFFSGEEDARGYMDYFLDSSPFDKQKDSFNFFFIDEYEPECELYAGEVLYCNSKEIVKRASSCPNDYIVVLDERPTDIRSSAYLNIMSINTNHPLTVFLHEWGHVFASFAEEYVDDSAKIPRSAKNCVKSCENFGEEVECFEGCTKSTFVRSIANGVMRTLSSEEFGAFSEGVLLERIREESDIDFLITGDVVEGDYGKCIEEEYYLIRLDSSGDLSVVSEGIGCAGKFGVGDTQFNLLDDENFISMEGSFNNKFIFTTNPFDKEEFRTFEVEEPVFFKILKTEENKKIVIEDFDGEVLGSMTLGGVTNRPELLLYNEEVLNG